MLRFLWEPFRGSLPPPLDAFPRKRHASRCSGIVDPVNDGRPELFSNRTAGTFLSCGVGHVLYFLPPMGQKHSTNNSTITKLRQPLKVEVLRPTRLSKLKCSALPADPWQLYGWYQQRREWADAWSCCCNWCARWDFRRWLVHLHFYDRAPCKPWDDWRWQVYSMGYITQWLNGNNTSPNTKWAFSMFRIPFMLLK